MPVGILETTTGEEAPVPEYPPDVEVAVWLEASPPASDGVNVTDADPDP